MVTPDPHILTLNANRDSADVGQSVTFTTTATPRFGNDQFVWSGLPSPCSTSNSSAYCEFLPTAGTFPVSVSVTDSSGYTSGSGATPFVVYPDPELSTPPAEPGLRGPRPIDRILSGRQSGRGRSGKLPVAVAPRTDRRALLCEPRSTRPSIA